MRSDLLLKLQTTYPRIFAAEKDGVELLALEDRVQCGDGWYPILDALCEALQWETDTYGHPQIVLMKAKNKLGSLRFQAPGPRSESQSGIIAMATTLSTRYPD